MLHLQTRADSKLELKVQKAFSTLSLEVERHSLHEFNSFADSLKNLDFFETISKITTLAQIIALYPKRNLKN